MGPSEIMISISRGEIFVTFDDKAGHNFIDRSGTNNFDTTRRIAI